MSNIVTSMYILVLMMYEIANSVLQVAFQNSATNWHQIQSHSLEQSTNAIQILSHLIECNPVINWEKQQTKSFLALERRICGLGRGKEESPGRDEAAL